MRCSCMVRVVWLSARWWSGCIGRSARCASTKGPVKSRSWSSHHRSTLPTRVPEARMLELESAANAQSAHADRFARDRLPARELWPVIEFTLPELQYPARLNCAAELLDRTAERLGADRIAIRFPGGQWNYGELRAQANRIAQVLIDDFGMEPGARVLLRGPNNPMLAACWLAVLKAGGIAVCTMSLLRER